MNQSIRIIPSDDSAFRRHVERLTAKHEFGSAEELAARLRRIFPRVTVRPSEVSGQDHVWYVYRDGVWQSSHDSRWWEDERTPRVVVSVDGWIERANAPARAILGLTASDPLPRHFTDFGAPGTTADATDLFVLVAAGHDLAATTLIRPVSGEIIACDLRAWLEDGNVHGAFRLADAIPVQPSTDMAVDHLRCEPESDALFARYAEEALAAMANPTPDGLMLRLRRLYPHARVEAGHGTWTVRRDAPGEGGPDDRWWTAPDLAAVRYDGQGLIVDANAQARALLGRELVGQHWQDLVTAGTTDEVVAVLELIATAGWALSRFRMPGPDGYLFEFDSYTEVAGDAFVTLMRPRQAEGETGQDYSRGG